MTRIGVFDKYVHGVSSDINVMGRARDLIHVWLLGLKLNKSVINMSGLREACGYILGLWHFRGSWTSVLSGPTGAISDLLFHLYFQTLEQSKS